jgi:hypothetical protein
VGGSGPNGVSGTGKDEGAREGAKAPFHGLIHADAYIGARPVITCDVACGEITKLCVAEQDGQHVAHSVAVATRLRQASSAQHRHAGTGGVG